MKKITNITKRNVKELFQSGLFSGPFEDERVIYRYHGRLEELEFLKRLYPISSMPSNDPRYKNAEEDILKHTVINDDFEYCWIFDDERFPLKYGEDEEYLHFFCEVFHPEVCVEGDLFNEFLSTLNSLLRKDGYELYEKDSVSGHSIYWWRVLTPQEVAAGKFIPFSQRYEQALKQKKITLSLKNSIRKKIIDILDKHEEKEDIFTDTNLHYIEDTKKAVWNEIQSFYKPKCFNDSKEYVEAPDLQKFILNNFPEKVFDVIELFSLYPSKKRFVEEINHLLIDFGWQLYDGKCMKSDKLPISVKVPNNDSSLKYLLSEAESLFNRPDQKQLAIEKLWDAFERIKTYNSADKLSSVKQIVNDIALDNDDLRKRIDNEFKELSNIGNTYQIRHFEKGKIPINDTDIIEYLFYRCLALIKLTIRATEKAGKGINISI